MSSQSPLLVIDGQQRLTTISLLLLALSRALEADGDGSRSTARKLHRDYLLQEEDEDEGVASMVRQTVSSIRSLDAAALAPDTGGGRLLGVDGNEINRDMLSRRLERQGYTPVPADGGRRALEMLRAEEFDLVLLDVHMPVMDGPETIAHIRASDAPWHAIPVIALTADAMSGDRERLLAMGMTGYATKPIDQAALEEEEEAAALEKPAADEEAAEGLAEEEEIVSSAVETAAETAWWGEGGTRAPGV